MPNPRGELPLDKCNSRYRKKPVVIEAFKFTGPFAANDVPQWFTDAVHNNEVILRGEWKTDYVEIPTLEGVMRANKGDWIIKGVKGELYPCKPEIFAATYEPANTRAESAAPLRGALANMVKHVKANFKDHDSVWVKNAEKALATAPEATGVREALGAHIQADAYRETFPDNDEDAAYLRKSETWWRLTARSWMSESEQAVCAEMAMKRVSNSPEVKAALDKMAKTLASSSTATEAGQ